MKDWKDILRRTDLITERERLKKLQEEKAKQKKNRAKTNAQIQAEQIRLTEYQEALARQLLSKQLRAEQLRVEQQTQFNSGWIGGGGQYQGSGSAAAGGGGGGGVSEAVMSLNDGWFTVNTGSNGLGIDGGGGLNINQYATFNYYASTTEEAEFVITEIDKPATGITLIALTPEKSFIPYNTYPNDSLVVYMASSNNARVYATGSNLHSWTWGSGGDLTFKVGTNGVVEIYDDGVLEYTSGEDFNASKYYISCNQLDNTAEIGGANATGSLTLDSGYPAESSTSTLVDFGTNVTGSGLYAAGLALDGGYFFCK